MYWIEVLTVTGRYQNGVGCARKVVRLVKELEDQVSEKPKS